MDLVSPIRVSPVAVGDSTTQIAGLDTAVFDRLYDLEVTSGSLAAVTPGKVAVSSGTADDRQLSLGDTVGITFARTGTVDLTVAAIFDEVVPGPGGTSWITDLATYEANVTDQYDRQVFVMADDAVDAATSRRRHRRGAGRLAQRASCRTRRSSRRRSRRRSTACST